MLCDQGTGILLVLNSPRPDSLRPTVASLPRIDRNRKIYKTIGRSPDQQTNARTGQVLSTGLAGVHWCEIHRAGTQDRAEAIQAEISARLGPRARSRRVVVESVEQEMAASAAAGPARDRSEREREIEDLNQTPEAQALMAKLSAEYWRFWPHIPLPVLSGQTPRQAAKTSAGRERLEVLFLDFASRGEIPGVLRPDVLALRREIGV